MPPIADASKVWFDWSVGGQGAPQTSAEIAAAMAAAGADLAIGNYCEDRDVYKGDAYEVTDEARRTVHLGVDLFAPAGTPEPLLSILRTDMQKAVTMDNGFNQSMVKLGAVPDYRPAVAFEEFLNKDAERLKATLMRISKVD